MDQTFDVNWHETGKITSLYYQILAGDGSILISRRATGIREEPTGSGCYAVTINNWDVDWSGRIVWDDGNDFASEAFGKTILPKAGGVRLSDDGLDTIPITAPTGPADSYRAMGVQLWRRFFKKAAMSFTELRTYADDGTTVITTQALVDDGENQTQGTAQ